MEVLKGNEEELDAIREKTKNKMISKTIDEIERVNDHERFRREMADLRDIALDYLVAFAKEENRIADEKEASSEETRRLQDEDESK